MKDVEEYGYKLLAVLEVDSLKKKTVKDAFFFKRRLKLVLKSKVIGETKIMTTKTWAVGV